MSNHGNNAATGGPDNGNAHFVEVPEGPDLRVPLQVVADLVFSEADNRDVMTRTGVTLDLSESGMRLALPEGPPAGTLLSVRLHLPDDDVYVCGGTVVRTGSSISSAGATHWVAVRFANLSTELRGRLRRCIWDMQRELRRRGDGGRLP